MVLKIFDVGSYRQAVISVSFEYPDIHCLRHLLIVWRTACKDRSRLPRLPLQL